MDYSSSSSSSSSAYKDKTDSDNWNNNQSLFKDESDDTTTSSFSESESKLGWTTSAFLSLLCYSFNNFLSGIQTGDVIAGKIANSYAIGIFAIAFIAFNL